MVGNRNHTVVVIILKKYFNKTNVTNFFNDFLKFKLIDNIDCVFFLNDFIYLSMLDNLSEYVCSNMYKHRVKHFKQDYYEFENGRERTHILLLYTSLMNVEIRYN